MLIILISVLIVGLLMHTYAKKKKLTHLPGWKWAVKSIDSSRLIRLARQICKGIRTEIKYQFGIQVP